MRERVGEEEEGGVFTLNMTHAHMSLYMLCLSHVNRHGRHHDYRSKRFHRDYGDSAFLCASSDHHYSSIIIGSLG